MKKKKLLGLMSLAVCSFGLISGVQASSIGGNPEYDESMLKAPVAIAVPDTNSIVGDATVSASDLKNVTITYNAGDLKMVGSDPSKGRTIDAAWVGIKIIAPNGYNFSNVGEPCTSSTSGCTPEGHKGPVYYGTDGEKKYFYTNQDTPAESKDDYDQKHFMYSYFAITEEFLRQATLKESVISYKLEFDWDADDLTDQTITINIEPEKITLKDIEEENELWNEGTYEEVREIVENAKEEAAKTHVVFVSKEDQNGEVSVDKKTAKEGETVTITVNPAEGYKLDTLKVLFGDKEVKVELVDGKYTFEMPTGNVNVKATFAKAEVNNPENGGEENVTDSDKEEVKEETKDETESKNPSTFDGIVGYVALAVSSVGTVAVSTKKVLK